MSTQPQQDSPQQDSYEREALAVANDPVLAQMLKEERVESSEIDTRLLLRLLGSLRRYPLLASIAMVLAIIEALLMTLPPWLIGVTVDSVLPDGRETMSAAGLKLLGFAERMSAFVPSASQATAALIVLCLLVLSVWLVRWALAATTSYIVQTLVRGLFTACGWMCSHTCCAWTLAIMTRTQSVGWLTAQLLMCSRCRSSSQTRWPRVLATCCLCWC